jgi:twitching motility protein PilT
VQVVESLIAAIVGADGDGLVMHVGEKPTVMTAAGAVVLPAATLTLGAMDDLLNDLLPAEARHALDEFGAVEADLPPTSVGGAERFTVIAARGGDDIWIELRRQRVLPFDVDPDSETGARSDKGRPSLSSLIAASASSRRPTIEEVLERREADAREERSAPAEAPANVLPLARNPARPDVARPRATSQVRQGGLERLLRVAAARGAETLYLFSQARPSIRVDGEISVLDAEPVLNPSDVEALLLEARPERRLDEADQAEWIVDITDVGRVRCVSFIDHRGPGAVFRMIPAKALSADQLGLSREIQSLCAEPEGLVLVVGPRSSGKSTLMAAFVDLINRSRSDHVITLESRIKVVHDSRSSLVSQREVRGDTDELLGALRAGLRESPDVLVIEDMRAPEVILEALEAASSGHLVIGGMAAHSATTALERIVDQVPSDRRTAVQGLIAESLRGVVGQVLLRKTGGGRIAAREVLLNTTGVAQLIAEGKVSQLPLAMESGRRLGMVPFADALVAFVQSGAVDVREAWRKAGDRQALLKGLRREGIDTSFAERLA